MMILAEQEESLIKVVRTLPGQTEKFLHWATQLADLAQGRKVEWSDRWSDEDIADFTAASVRNFDEREREDR
jgi:hypothetical protein